MRMKNRLIFFLFLIPVFAAFSQEADTLTTSKPTIGKVSSVIDIQDLIKDGFNYWEDSFTGHWAGVFFGVNGFAKADYSMYPAEENGFLDNNLRKSHALHINLFQFSKGLQNKRNTIGFVTGFGLGIQSYHLDRNTTFEKDAFGKVQPRTLYFDSNQKSKLSSVYLNVPLLVEFQIPVKHYANRLYLSGGIVGSKRLSSHTKIKYRKDRQKQKLKTPDSFSMNDYKVSAVVRAGYRWVNVFASVDLTPMFEKEMGPEVYPFTVGIGLISF